MISTVFWDWNGTLVADVPLVVRVNNQVFANHGFRLTDEEEYRRLFCFPVKDYYEKMGVSEADYYRIAGEWSQASHQQFPGTPLSPHAAETVRRLHDAGLRMVILSASKETLLLEQLAQYPELDGCFDRVMGLTDIYAVSKVQRGVDFLREAGIPGDEAVFLGDTLHDAEVARAMALGVRVLTGADLAVSVTGLAGPDGDDRGNPVGTVFVGLSAPEGVTVRHLTLGGDRERIRTLSAHHAFDMLRRYLTNLPTEGE